MTNVATEQKLNRRVIAIVARKETGQLKRRVVAPVARKKRKESKPSRRCDRREKRNRTDLTPRRCARREKKEKKANRRVVAIVARKQPTLLTFAKIKTSRSSRHPEKIISMINRPRRNRKSEAIRSLVRENEVKVSDLIFPLFIIEGKNKKSEVASMPGIYRYSPDLLLKEIESCLKLGITTFCLFPNIDDKLKDKIATQSHNPKGLYLRTIREVKKKLPQACIMTDVAMDPYSSDGHDGLVRNGEILNDETLHILSHMALAQAEAGADIIGPSDMMDGRVGFIRQQLDKGGFTNVSIMSYTAKYASAFYGPFRDALSSAPKFGDKKTYQMDPSNSREALIEATLDMEEGADFLMVKPALSYLDVIKLLNDNFDLPIAAYNVSGEYAMVKAAGAKGWINADKVRDEILLSIKRAGAKIILTYFAKEFALSRK